MPRAHESGFKFDWRRSRFALFASEKEKVGRRCPVLEGGEPRGERSARCAPSYSRLAGSACSDVEPFYCTVLQQRSGYETTHAHTQNPKTTYTGERIRRTRLNHGGDTYKAYGLKRWLRFDKLHSIVNYRPDHQKLTFWPRLDFLVLLREEHFFFTRSHLGHRQDDWTDMHADESRARRGCTEKHRRAWTEMSQRLFPIPASPPSVQLLRPFIRFYRVRSARKKGC